MRIKNSDISKSDEYVDIPDVAIDEVIESITLEKLSPGMIKK